jgi:hypothetical protein
MGELELIEKIKSGNIAFHCRTEESANNLLSKLGEMGFDWHAYMSNTNFSKKWGSSKTMWGINKDKTCYIIDNNYIQFLNINSLPIYYCDHLLVDYSIFRAKKLINEYHNEIK